jgi:serine/threonine protein phosphatase PrpC
MNASVKKQKPVAPTSSGGVAGDIAHGCFGSIGATRVREFEDRFQTAEVKTQSGLKLVLAAIADGVGGGSIGERAAQLSLDTVFASCQASASTNVAKILQSAVEAANAAVYAETRQELSKRKMATTLAVAAVHQNKLYIANVGDSRIYLIRNNNASQLTVDHSWAYEQIRAGMDPDKAHNHPRSSDLARSIGSNPTVTVDLGLYLQGEKDPNADQQQGLPLLPGDSVLVCSDGLIKSDPAGNPYAKPSEFAAALHNSSSPELAAKTLVGIANGRNVDDNVSVAILTVPGGKKPLLTGLPAGWPLWAGGALALMLLLILGVWWAGRGQAANNSSVTQPGQAYVVSVTGDAQLSTADSAARAVASGENIPFSPRTLLKVANQAKIQLALPGDISLQAANNTQTELSTAAENSSTFDLQDGLLVVSTDLKTRPNSSLTINTRYGNLTYTQTNAGIETAFCAQVSAATRQLQLQCVKGSCPLPDSSTFTPDDGVKVFDENGQPKTDNPPPEIPNCSALANAAASIPTPTPGLPASTETPSPTTAADSTTNGSAATSTLAPTNAVWPTATRKAGPTGVPVTAAPFLTNTHMPTEALQPQPVPVTPVPPTAVPPTAVLPTTVPPQPMPVTPVPPQPMPVTPMPPQPMPVTPVPPQPAKVCNPGQWDGCQTHGCEPGNVAYCSDAGAWTCKPDPAKCNAQPPVDIPPAPGGGGTDPTNTFVPPPA